MPVAVAVAYRGGDLGRDDGHNGSDTCRLSNHSSLTGAQRNPGHGGAVGTHAMQTGALFVCFIA